MVALSRRQREQARHRDEILLAAGEVFADKGFFGTTMEDIAQASEFAIGSLYKHFRNKEALFGALFERKIDALVEGLEEVLHQERSFVDSLDAFLGRFIDFALTNASFLRLLTTASRAADWHSASVRAAMEPVMERYRLAVQALVIRGLDEGVLRPLRPEELTAYTIGVLHAFFHMWLTTGVDLDLSTRAPDLRMLLLGGLARGGACAAPEPPEL